MRTLLVGLLLCCSCIAVAAGGPRPGPITVLETTSPDAATLQYLAENDFDYERGAGGVVRIYVTDAELATLQQRGLAFTIVDRQPHAPASNEYAKGLGAYHTHDTMTTELQAYVTAHPDICRMVNIGDSVQGRALWAVEISRNPDQSEDEPELKYVGSLHGDEPIGVEMCMYFIDYVLGQYGGTTTEAQRVNRLVDNAEIWVVPMANPDGNALSTRYNANGYDLNRSFPSFVKDHATGNIYDGGALGDTGRPVEVQHLMQWTAQHHFTISANLHSGSLVVNYPFDEGVGVMNANTPSPDDALFRVVSEAYSKFNTPMWNNPEFKHGITNGGAWYTTYGGMQDWCYRYLSDNDETIELSNAKKPDASQLPTYWSQNNESMLSYFEQAFLGLHGRVYDAASGQPLYAKVSIEGIAHPVYTDPAVGDYTRMLLPNTYTVDIAASGYVTRVVPGVEVAANATTRMDVALQPLAAEGEGEGNAEGEGSPEPVYFVMADPSTPDHGAYILPLTNAADIAHARAVIADPDHTDAHIAVAHIAKGGQAGDYVNQDPLHANRLWSWRVADFVGFADTTVEIYDSWADYVESNLDAWLSETNSTIGFWSYRVVSEIGVDTEGEGEGASTTIHSADENGDYRIDISELLRVIQFYNVGSYHCAALSEDGFNPGPGDHTCTPHNSDYNPQDWSINLSELLRLIQFFNGGGYHVCADGEDGFCSGQR